MHRTPENRGMAGAFPPLPFQKGATGAEVLYHNSIIGNFMQSFLKRFRDPIRVHRISKWVPRIRKNYHRVPKIRENLVPRIREIGPLQIQTGFLTFSLKETLFMVYQDRLEINLLQLFGHPDNSEFSIISVIILEVNVV